MTDQLALENKICLFKQKDVTLNGISPDQFSCLFNSFLKKSELLNWKRCLYVFSEESSAENFYQNFKTDNVSVFYPGLGSDIYSSILPSETNLFNRFNVINRILDSEPINIITTVEALTLLIPPKEFFDDKFLISVSDIISPLELAERLVDLGYQKTFSVEEPGTFSNRGEIFDVYPMTGPPFRIYYFDDMIEEMFFIDKENLKTKRDVSLETISVNRTPFSIFTDEFKNNFKNNFPRPTPQQRELYDYRKEVFTKLNNNQLFEDYPIFFAQFFNTKTNLSTYLEEFNVFYFDRHEIEQSLTELKDNAQDEYKSFVDIEEQILKPSPGSVYSFNLVEGGKSSLNLNNLVVEALLDNELKAVIDLSIKPIPFIRHSTDKDKHFNSLLEFIGKHALNGSKLYIVYHDSNSLEEVKYIMQNKLENYEQVISKIKFVQGHLEAGFSYESESLHFVSTGDFFAKKAVKTKKRRKENINQDMFADQLATLNIGDYVIHKNHGLALYQGIETLDLNGNESDYITLLYQDNDKVYVPVYRMNLLQKFSTKDSSLSIANLKSKKFDLLKTKAKSSVKKLAFDLLELQARRNSQVSFAFSPPDHEYNEFCLNFKFETTVDQGQAIDDVIDDMQSTKPMDRLVCGDVGFGKTEVAMRASYKAVLDDKQVCILVPTTVLSLQHYNSFIERFKNTPVVIEFLSRFKTAKETKEIIARMADGKVDIVIGTHKLLSDKIKFKDLGLVVIDEEQRFGVGHKEKLKLLKETVDTLTLTATPIPRTLQMSFLGIKELSLIKTAPPKRQSIKTYIIKEDFQTMRAAIEKELNRGGQIFIVHNKVSDIELYTSKIRELVPKAKIMYAHGQMPERELEKRIADFYAHKFDILIATTIIESGIDIPNANTMIIDRADTYGLSQLHQLRGRIGRSHKKAYAYFVIPKHKKLSDIAAKRLKALQTYAEIGAGFSLASSDLEIRGSGDILGAEQSGHLANIGLELYMELLQEAIQNIKGESVEQFQDIEIQSKFNSFIPKEYIENANIRLKYYKKLSNRRKLDGIQEIIDELSDQYGALPEEVNNLISLLKTRVHLQGLGINRLNVRTHAVTIFFNKEFIENNTNIQTSLVSFFMQRPKIYKINPDFSIICTFKDKINLLTLFQFAKHIAEQIKTC
jgi:transcription-repair coupling factor (superfamily II helicase)